MTTLRKIEREVLSLIKRMIVLNNSYIHLKTQNSRFLRKKGKEIRTMDIVEQGGRATELVELINTLETALKRFRQDTGFYGRRSDSMTRHLRGSALALARCDEYVVRVECPPIRYNRSEHCFAVTR